MTNTSAVSVGAGLGGLIKCGSQALMRLRITDSWDHAMQTAKCRCDGKVKVPQDPLRRHYPQASKHALSGVIYERLSNVKQADKQVSYTAVFRSGLREVDDINRLPLTRKMKLWPCRPQSPLGPSQTRFWTFVSPLDIADIAVRWEQGAVADNPPMTRLSVSILSSPEILDALDLRIQKRSS